MKNVFHAAEGHTIDPVFWSEVLQNIYCGGGGMHNIPVYIVISTIFRPILQVQLAKNYNKTKQNKINLVMLVRVMLVKKEAYNDEASLQSVHF